MQHPLAFPLSDLDQNGILLELPGYSNIPRPTAALPVGSLEKEPVGFQQYQSRFERVMQEIRHGNSYLLNLTQPTVLRSGNSAATLFQHAQATFKLRIPGQFSVFSPERFVRIRERSILTYPMKGTANASLPDAAGRLIADPKEMAEHYTIVDLLRNDLNAVSRNVRVNRFRYLDRIETDRGGLLQASSEIEGRLPADWHRSIGTLFSTLLPAGSVTGAPKKKTVEIILDAEGYDRGWYTGVFGWFNGRELDSAVMIRYLEETCNGLVYKSGGGITALSEARSEYQELIDKIYVPVSRDHSPGKRVLAAPGVASAAPE